MKMKNEKTKLKKKFIPRKTPRYLPGEVSNQLCMRDLESYNRHLYRVFTAKAKIDTDPPKLNVMKILGINKMLRDYEMLKRRAHTNKNLVMRINIINRTHGFVDCYNKRANLKLSKLDAIQPKLKRINIDNKNLYKRIVNKTSQYSRKEYEAQWKKMLVRIQMQAKYPIQTLQQKSPDKELSERKSISQLLPLSEKHLQPPDRPKVFMVLGVKGYVPIGKFVFELYKDIVPISVAVFLTRIEPKKNVKSFVGEYFNKIIPNEYCEIGIYDKRVRRKNPIYTNSFSQENFSLSHTRPGVLSLAPTETGKNSAQFSITFEEYPKFDGVRVVIGKLIHGYKYLQILQDYGKKIGKPTYNVQIQSCGIIKGVQK